MTYTAPRSLHDIAVDGLILQAFIDEQLRPYFARVTATEVSRTSELDFDVRFGFSGSKDEDFTATAMARIDDAGWTWLGPVVANAAEALGIAALTGTQPAETPELLAAARTIAHNVPVREIQFPSGERYVLALHMPLPTPQPPLHPILYAAGIPAADVPRALAAFEVITGADTSGVLLRDGAPYDLPHGMLLDGVRADAHYLSAEHQLLFDALVPGDSGTMDLELGTVNFTTARGPLTATVAILATVREGVWTWAWADPFLAHTHCMQSSLKVRNFGQQNAIPALCTAQLPLERAEKWNLIQVAKPIVHQWTHAKIPLTPETYAVTLVSHPSLALPPASAAAVAATLATPMSAELPAPKALEFYCAARQLPHNGNQIMVGTDVVQAHAY